MSRTTYKESIIHDWGYFHVARNWCSIRRMEANAADQLKEYRGQGIKLQNRVFVRANGEPLHNSWDDNHRSSTYHDGWRYNMGYQLRKRLFSGDRYLLYSRMNWDKQQQLIDILLHDFYPGIFLKLSDRDYRKQRKFKQLNRLPEGVDYDETNRQI